MSGGPGAEAMRSPPRGGGGGRGPGLLAVGQRLGPGDLETLGRWVDPSGRTPRPALRGRAPLRAASRRPGWGFLAGSDRGRTVPARKGVRVASGVGLGRGLAGPPGAFGAQVGALVLLQRSPGSAGDLSFC